MDATQQRLPGSRDEPEADVASSLWEGAYRLLARASVEDVLAHRVGALAAKGARARGAEVPSAFVEEERAAALSALTARPLVARIRAVADGPVMLLKGPEVAALYPHGGRRFIDVDVLSPSAHALQRALLASGFVEEPDDEDYFADHHHLPPIRDPSLPLAVEVHARTNWLVDRRPPPVDELFEAAVPSVTGIDGVVAPHPRHHAIVLAVHAWRHAPLVRLRDLVDVAAVAALVPAAELDDQARSWGVERVWRTVTSTNAALFSGGPPPLPLRTWARHLAVPRQQTVLERHVSRFVCGYWEAGAATATRRLGHVARDELRRADGESWGQKLYRIAGATRDARAPASRRDERSANG